MEISNGNDYWRNLQFSLLEMRCLLVPFCKEEHISPLHYSPFYTFPSFYDSFWHCRSIEKGGLSPGWLRLDLYAQIVTRLIMSNWTILLALCNTIFYTLHSPFHLMAQIHENGHDFQEISQRCLQWDNRLWCDSSFSLPSFLSLPVEFSWHATATPPHFSIFYTLQSLSRTHWTAAKGHIHLKTCRPPKKLRPRVPLWWHQLPHHGLLEHLPTVLVK